MTIERATYRIVYSGDVAPRLHIPGDRWPCPVVDCSETGVRLVRARGETRRIASGQRVAGVVEFCNGTRVEVSGRVVRIQGSEIALHLDKQPIPFPDIIREQIYLRRHHQVQRTIEAGDPVDRRRIM
jgi:hypothetical protein